MKKKLILIDCIDQVSSKYWQYEYLYKSKFDIFRQVLRILSKKVRKCYQTKNINYLLKTWRQ